MPWGVKGGVLGERTGEVWLESHSRGQRDLWVTNQNGARGYSFLLYRFFLFNDHFFRKLQF